MVKRQSIQHIVLGELDDESLGEVPGSLAGSLAVEQGSEGQGGRI